MSRPVSVVMPVWNSAATLAAAIESILAQSFGDFEFIVVDDGSDDASRDIAEDYARRDRRIRTLALARDPALVSGARAANAGIALSEGDFVARMDSDDISLPGRLAIELEHLRANDLGICGGQALIFGEREGPLWYPQSREGIRSELVFRSAMLNPTLLVRGPLMREARYREADAFEEYEFLTRMFFRARMGSTPETVHRFRKHARNTTTIFASRKADSRWQLRFRYFFRLFPEAALGDFQLIHRIRRAIPIESAEQLEAAGQWLVRLSRVDEAAVRAKMKERWEETCGLAAVAPERVAALRAPFAERIEAPP